MAEAAPPIAVAVPLGPGVGVRVVGIPQFNGCVGTIVSSGTNGCWQVSLNGGGGLRAFRPQNLAADNTPPGVMSTPAAVARSLRPRGVESGNDPRGGLLPELPPGWEQFLDDYGRPYFYSEKLGVTQWER